MKPNRPQPAGLRRAMLAVAFCVVATLSLLGEESRTDRDRAEIVALSSRWVSAVADQDPGFVDLLDTGAHEHYERLRGLALHGDASQLEALDPIDQLQVLFMRLTIDANPLQEMSSREILVRAVDQKWIGQDLRRTDELREVTVEGNTAAGRLYKFGLEDRPDRGRQYFTRENEQWRVSLRGERERLQLGFESFVARSGLVPSEAAFFILEMRLLRKVTPADFKPVASERGPGIGGFSAPENPGDDAPLRIVAIRESPDDPSLVAVTIEDREESLRFVLSVGESFGRETQHRLVRVTGHRAWLERDGTRLALDLEMDGPPLDQRLRSEKAPAKTVSLLEQAQLGEHREGLMTQWRNVGLRGRPQLLQQAWFNPVHDSDGSMLGLKVRKLAEGSFWHQLGLAKEDLLEQLNGDLLDSMDRWQELVRVAGTDREISIVVRRDGQRLRFRTKTVPPRSVGKPA